MHARNVGPGQLALVFVSRAVPGHADEFLCDAGSYSDC
jgi:hypothetical protein